MEYITAIAFLLVGFAILIAGGEFLVKSAVSIAARFKISPSVVGLTIVAAGTSTPELITSVMASLNGSPDIAVGNVIGSNTFNILAILGITFLIAKTQFDKRIFKNELPQLLIVSLVFFYFISDLTLSRLEGLLLLLLFAASVTYTLLATKTDDTEDALEILKQQWHDLVFLVGGICCLLLGAHVALLGGVELGKLFGLSERVIGVTIISAGTGMPELITSAVAAIRKQSKIAISNVVGSNIMNTLAVGGGASAITQLSVNPQIFSTDILIMIAATVSIFIVAIVTKFSPGRLAGFVYLSCYIAYIKYLLQPT